MIRKHKARVYSGDCRAPDVRALLPSDDRVGTKMLPRRILVTARMLPRRNPGASPKT